MATNNGNKNPQEESYFERENREALLEMLKKRKRPAAPREQVEIEEKKRSAG